MAACLDKLDDRMVVSSRNTRLSRYRPGGIGEDTARRRMSECSLSHSLRASEQPGVVKLACFPRRGKLRYCLVLAGDHGSKSSRSTSSRCVTSSGEPDASTS